MSERIQTEYRQALSDFTATWSAKESGPLEAYHDFNNLLGDRADNYTDYLGTAITAGGYKRDPRLSYGEVVANNSAYALDMADELHRAGALDVHNAIDAVSLGKVKGWGQSDYLLFFFNIMARPAGDAHYPLDKALKELMAKHPGFSLDIFNNEKLPNEERIPHYLGFAQAYWSTIQNDFDLKPVERMVELSDWNMSLGGRAEEELARQMGIRVARPSFLIYSDILGVSSLSPALREKVENLRAMGANVFAPTQLPKLGLQDIPL